MTIPSPLRPCDCPCSHRRSRAVEKARERTNAERHEGHAGAARS
ncbi:unnamed protein product [Ectocarpus sp. 4 AP-2014]